MDEEEILKAWGLEDDETPEEDLDEGAEDIEDEDLEDEDLEDEEPEEADGEEPEGGEPEDPDEEEPADPLAGERERIIAENQRATEAALDAQVASLGLKDPYRDNAPIKTHQELMAFQQRSRQEKLTRLAKAGGLTEQEVQELIDQQPDVAAAKQLRQQMEQQTEAENLRRAQAALNADLQEIEKLMPGVGTKEGVTSHSSWPEVHRLMEDNPRMGLLQAFRAVNAEAIAANVAGKAATAAKRKAAGKGHLKTTGGRGKGLPEVPPEVAKVYRTWEPNITDAEMRKAYAEDMGIH